MLLLAGRGRHVGVGDAAVGAAGGPIGAGLGFPGDLRRRVAGVLLLVAQALGRMVLAAAVGRGARRRA